MGVARPLSKPEYECLVAGRVAQGFSIRRVKELISQSKPTAQLRRGLCYGSGPPLAGECSFNFSEGRILPQRKQCYPRAFRYRQFEVTGVRKADERLANERCGWCAIHKLAAPDLPSGSWLRKFMARDGCTTYYAKRDNRQKAHKSSSRGLSGRGRTHEITPAVSAGTGACSFFGKSDRRGENAKNFCACTKK